MMRDSQRGWEGGGWGWSVPKHYSNHPQHCDYNQNVNNATEEKIYMIQPLLSSYPGVCSDCCLKEVGRSIRVYHKLA